jgi:hypothetical protein
MPEETTLAAQSDTRRNGACSRFSLAALVGASGYVQIPRGIGDIHGEQLQSPIILCLRLSNEQAHPSHSGFELLTFFGEGPEPAEGRCQCQFME